MADDKPDKGTLTDDKLTATVHVQPGVMSDGTFTPHGLRVSVTISHRDLKVARAQAADKATRNAGPIAARIGAARIESDDDPDLKPYTLVRVDE